MTRLDKLEERLDLIDERIAKLELEVYEEVSVLEATLAKVCLKCVCQHSRT